MPSKKQRMQQMLDRVYRRGMHNFGFEGSVTGGLRRVGSRGIECVVVDFDADGHGRVRAPVVDLFVGARVDMVVA